MLDLSLRDLEYVLTIWRERNITRAAEHLHMAQPALSQSLRRIERRLGVSLFDRSSRRITPTEAGTGLALAAERILADVGRAVVQARAAGGVTAPVRVHVSEPSLVTPRLVLGAIRENLPEMAVHQTSLPWAQVGEQLVAGDLALAIAGRLRSPEVISLHLRDERVGVLVCRSHPLAERDTVGPEDLIGFPLLSIDEEMSTWNRWVTHYLTEYRITPRWSREVVFGLSTGSDALVGSQNVLLTLESVTRPAELLWIPFAPTRLVPWFVNVARKAMRREPQVAAALQVVERLAADEGWRDAASSAPRSSTGADWL